MTRLKSVVAAIAIGLLIPSLSLGITERERIGQVRDIVDPFTSAGLPGSTDPKDAAVLAKFKELREKLKLSEVEKKWFDLVAKAAKERDDAKAAGTLPELLARKISDEKEQKRQQFAALFPSLQAPAQQLNAARLKSSEDSCPANFQGYAQLASVLSSDLVTQMQQNGQKFMKQSKEEKLATIEQLKALNKQFKDNIKSQREKEQRLADQREKRSFKDSVAQMKSGIEGLKDLTKELENERDQRLAALGDTLFEKFLPKALEDNKDQKELLQVAMQIQAKLEPERQTALNQGLQSAADVAESCEDIVKAIKTGEKGQPGIATTVMQVAASQNPPEVAAQYNQSVQQVAQELKCSSGEDAIQAALGETMRSKIASLSSVPDSVTLMQSVLNLVPEMVNAVGTTQGPLEDSIKDCVTAAEQKEAFVAMIGSAQNAASGPAQARLAGQRRQNLSPNAQASTGQSNPFSSRVHQQK